MRAAWRYILIGIGSVALTLGVVGIFVPMWPTTPFMLLAAACYIRSSERLHRWLLDHRYLGKYVRDFVSGKGIPRAAKATALLALWVTTTMSSAIVVGRFGVRPWPLTYAAALTLIAASVHYYIGFRIPTRTPATQAAKTTARPSEASE